MLGLSWRPAARMAAGALFLLLLVPLSAAQVPLPREQSGQALAISVICLDASLEPDYAGQDTVTCTIEDLSRDSVTTPGSGSGTGTQAHQILISTRPTPASANITGYQVIVTEPIMNLFGGDRRTFDVNVKATPQVSAQDYSFELVATYSHSASGYNQTIVIPFNAQVNPYDFALLSWSGSQSQKAGQDDIVTYSIAIQNTGVYPDTYRFTITAKPDLHVTTPSNVYVGPGETRIVNVSVLTPHGKLFEMGRSEAIGIKVNSMGVGGITGSGVYSTTALLQIRGAYVPVYWIPLFLVGFVSLGIVVRGGRDKAERARLERGAPRPVDLTPRQAVLLAEMRRSDPATYKEKKRALDTVYVERRQDYRAHRKEREAADRAEAKQAKAEFLAQKKARKAERAAARRQAALDAKAAKKEAKLVAKKEKVLAKKRKALAKAQAKQAALDAKAAAKQAKKDAAAQKKQEAEQRKAEKAQQKAAKAKK